MVLQDKNQLHVFQITDDQFNSIEPTIANYTFQARVDERQPTLDGQ